MSALEPVLKKLRAIDAEALLNLRPDYPPVAVEVGRGQMTLARVKRSRGKVSLLAHRVQAAPEQSVGQSIFRPNIGSLEETAAQIRELFQSTGTKPGRVSVILPDNLAKVSIVSLPEKPTSRRQLEELLRFRLRRSVPFRLEDATLSSWPLASDGAGADLLVAVMLRSVVEQYEAAFEAIGARPGVVDLCTPSLLNLVRADVAEASASGDVALLNASRTYFTLLIVRAGRVVFFRCKSYAGGEEDAAARTALMARELATSLSYYQEKLAGEGIRTAFVRSYGQPFDDVTACLARIGVDTFRAIDPAAILDPAGIAGIASDELASLGPALGAAVGRAA